MRISARKVNKIGLFAFSLKRTRKLLQIDITSLFFLSKLSSGNVEWKNEYGPLGLLFPNIYLSCYLFVLDLILSVTEEDLTTRKLYDIENVKWFNLNIEITFRYNYK